MIMGLFASTLRAIEPRLGEGPVPQQSLRRLQATCITWALASYIKLGVINITAASRSTSTSRIKKIQGLLKVYYFASWYLALRFVLPSATPGSTLGLLARLGCVRRRHVSALVAVIAGLDELAYTAILVSVERGVVLKEAIHKATATTSSERDDEMICCICYDDDSLQAADLRCYCTHSAGHVSHTECMNAWLVSGAVRSTSCPMCRKPLKLAVRTRRERLLKLLCSSSHWRALLARGALSFLCLATVLGLRWCSDRLQAWVWRPPLDCRGTLALPPAALPSRM